MNRYFVIFCALMISGNLLASGDPPVKKIEWQKATFAGGLFWFLDEVFDRAEGTQDCVTGYANGKKRNAYFDLVDGGKTGHMMAVQITFNPVVISYKELLDAFWQNINPLDSKGQFIDRGGQYSSAILFHNEQQKKHAEESLKALKDKKVFEKEIVTQIIPFKSFYPAEKKHQDAFRWYKGNYFRYKEYSGRNTFKEKYWKKPIVLKKKSIKII